ncbi:MAG: glycosyltransferase family 4 protein [Kiritimatiellae bacterium]|nr:glycosyltransferase family 4 protein [Kiritimatiellia bacterium]
MSSTSPRKPRLALWFRYGPNEHARLFHALIPLLERLSARYEIHYWGMRSREHPDEPDGMAAYAQVHFLPFSISRVDERDKTFKTLLWMLFLPWLALWSRLKGIRFVYMDETIPLALPIARLFFGNRVTLTVGDLFCEQYLQGEGLKGLLRRWVEAWDARAWRKAPFLITRSAAGPAFLAERFGVEAENVFYAHDSVDVGLYAPAESLEVREGLRRRMGWGPDDFVLVFHGLLNPAKDLDTPFEALPGILEKQPRFRLVLLGNGPEEARLREKARKLGIEGAVEFRGYTLETVVAEALAAADAGLVARRPDDASHLVVTSVLGHCLAAGLPVVAARTAGVARLVTHGETAMLYAPGDVADFQATVLRLVGSRELRADLARKGLQLARERLSVEEEVERNAEPFLTRWP